MHVYEQFDGTFLMFVHGILSTYIIYIHTLKLSEDAVCTCVRKRVYAGRWNEGGDWFSGTASKVSIEHLQ